MSPKTAETQALIDLLAEDARQRGGDATGQPTADELLAYHQGRLAPEREAAIGRQLVAQPELARMLLDLVELAEAAPPAPEAPADLATRAAWRQLEKRLAAPAPASRQPAPRWWIGLAAASLLLSIGLGSKVPALVAKLESQRERVAELEQQLRQPLANLQSLELFATRSAIVPSLQIRRQDEPIGLVVLVEEICPFYDAELRREDAPGSWPVANLVRDERNRLTLLLHPEPGDYTLGIFGCEPRHELQSHPFRIVRQDPGGG